MRKQINFNELFYPSKKKNKYLFWIKWSQYFGTFFQATILVSQPHLRKMEQGMEHIFENKLYHIFRQIKYDYYYNLDFL